MTFTAKAFIVCDLGRRGADLSWPTVMPFNTVINPDAMTGTVGWGPPLATLPPPFFPPHSPPSAVPLGGQRGVRTGSSRLKVTAEGWASPEHLTGTPAGYAPPGSRGAWGCPTARPRAPPQHPCSWHCAGGTALVLPEGGRRGISHHSLGPKSQRLLFTCRSPLKDVLVNV